MFHVKQFQGRWFEVNEIINAIINNGAAVGLLIYFVFRDYKYISDLTIAVNTLQITVNELRNDIEMIRKVKEDDDNNALFWLWIYVSTLRKYSNKPTRLLCPWNFPGENIGVSCHFLLQGIFLTRRLNPHLLWLLHWQVYSLPLSHLGSFMGDEVREK